MEASVWMWINRRLHLSPTMYNITRSFADFKAYMHNLYIKVGKDPRQTWTKLSFITIDDAIFSILESWPTEWCILDVVEKDRIIA